MDRKYEKIIEITSIIALIITALIGLGHSIILRVFGISAEPLTLILVITSTLAGGLGLERIVRLRQVNKLWEKIEQGPEDIIRALNGVEVKRFANATQMYLYVIEKLRAANTQIDDLTWGDAEAEKTEAAEKAYQKYVDTISKICSEKKGISYREIMSFSSESQITHFNRAGNILAKDFKYGYELRYYAFPTIQGKPLLNTSIPPPLTMMIVDSEEVILVSWDASNRQLGREHLAIKHPDIVRFFQEYYEQIWNKAEKLKTTVDLEEIKNQLKN